jgi:nitroreductase
MTRRDFLLGAGGVLLAGGLGAYGWRSAIGSMADYDRYTADIRRPLSVDGVAGDLVRYATLAANGHNTQPWRFLITDSVITIRADPSRATPAVDPDDHHMFVSLGCATENLALAAAAAGKPGAADVDAEGRIEFRQSVGRPVQDPLFAAIPKRQSTRAVYDGRPVPAGVLDSLTRAAAIPGVRMVVVTKRRLLDQLRDLVVAGNDQQMLDQAFIDELKHWLRFNPRNAMEKGDGLFSASSGNPVLPGILGGPAFDAFFSAAAENDRYARQIDSSAAIAVFLGEREDRQHWVAVGRACQRFALAATLSGLKHAFINQPVEVKALRSQLSSLIGEPGVRPDIMMRFGYGADLPYSPRRPVAAVLDQP